MTDCEHLLLDDGTPQFKRIGGQEFRFSARMCLDCGAVLWNREVEDAYASWIRENKEKFTSQYSLTLAVVQGVGEILVRYPTVTESQFARAAVVVFLNFVFPNPTLSRATDALVEGPIYKALVGDRARQKLKVRMNPMLLEAAETWASLLGMTVGKFIEECVTRMIVLFRERDTVDLWANEIDRQLDTVLKAAS